MKYFLFTFLFFSVCDFLEANERPNILVIMADDLGYGDLSAQGAQDVFTPNIDQLAKQGLTLSQFYANSTVCSPSRASFITGKYPDKAGVPGVVRQHPSINWGYLDPKSQTVADQLKKNGYQTALIGKWHLGLSSPNLPNERGFDHFHGFLGDMMDDYWTHLRDGVNWMRLNGKEITAKGHATDIFTDWAVDYITESTKSAQPFFLFLSYNAPHFPIQPPEKYLNRVQKREANLSDKRAKNVAFIEHLDDGVGRVLQQITSLGLDKNTLIIFTSDNGGALRYSQSNGKLRGGKGDMYEGGIRVPTFVRWQGKIKENQRTDNVGMLMDLFPTFIDIIQGQIPSNIDGVSLLSTLLTPEEKTSERTLFWVRKEGWDHNGLSYYAARSGDYKLVQSTPYQPFEYYNLFADPYEKTPLAEKSVKAFSQLREKLTQHIRAAGHVPWQREPIENTLKQN